jgi:uncharacterized protein (DUF305 family)
VTASRRAVVLGAIAAAAPARSSLAQHASGHHPGAEAEFSAGLHRSMDAMMRGMGGAMSGDADRDFLAAMIPHHEAAIEMARLALVHCRDPLVRQLADEIIASQQAEIASMRGRLRLLENGDSSPEYPALTGTRG